MRERNMHHERGAVLMVAVMFFVLVGSAIALGLSGPVARMYRLANDSLLAKQSYFLAESGTEDAYYRLKTSKDLSSSETLVLAGATTTTTITDIGGGQKEIAAIGNNKNRERTVDLKVTVTTGVSFNYGVQVGQGGFNIAGGSSLNGNIYANGPITGDGGSSINGTAVSANSSALTPDQSNGSGTPAYNVSFGNANTTQDIAQSFVVSTGTSPLNKVQLYIKKVGSPSNATVRIVADNSGVPGTTTLVSGTLSASAVTTSYGWVDVSFSTNPTLSTGTTYWLVVDASTSNSKYYVIGASNGGYASGTGKIGQFSSTWNNTSPSGLDYFFKLYLGGFTGLIQGNSGSQWNPVAVNGNAQAHTVNYTSATGTIYCTAGTGNNKSCTAASDPAYQAMPVSDANIDSWKTEAAAGGTISGSYSVGWAGATVGPKKIDGNLTISGGGVLTVTGTLWVTGNLSLSGGGKIQLDSSYGANDGVVVVDGTISVSGGGFANGSGTTGSYIMLLSTAYGTAATISGGSGAVIMYAPNGTLSLSGGVALKEATAYRVSIDGGSSITYESGLANNNFSTGPSGSYGINSWRETQ